MVVLVAGPIRLFIAWAFQHDTRRRAVVLRTCSMLFWSTRALLCAVALSLQWDGVPAAIVFPLELAGLVLLIRAVHAISLGIERRREERWS